MEQLWEQALGSLKTHLSDENFETWLEPVQFGGIDSGSVVLRIPNQFFADWISANYLDMILETLQSEAGERAPFPRRYVGSSTRHSAKRPRPPASRLRRPLPARRGPLRARRKRPISIQSTGSRTSSWVPPISLRTPRAWLAARTPGADTTRSSSMEASASARRTSSMRSVMPSCSAILAREFFTSQRSDSPTSSFGRCRTTRSIHSASATGLSAMSC